MIIKIIIILLSLLNSGFIAFDGGRALITGDYIRPSSGTHAGQLGPWHKLVSAIGIDPMSNLMKSIFLLAGIYGLIATSLFIFNPQRGWMLLLIFCIATIWNIVPGTMSSILVIILLVIYKWKFMHP